MEIAPRKAIPSWLSEARSLLKRALSGSNAFGPRYCRQTMPRARILWVYGLLMKKAPISTAFNMQVKKSFLALSARIAKALAKKQAQRAARRQDACKKIRMARFQATGLAAYARQQGKLQSGAGIYRIVLDAKRVAGPTAKSSRKRSVKRKTVCKILPAQREQVFPEGFITPGFWESSGLLAEKRVLQPSPFIVHTDVHTSEVLSSEEFTVGPKRAYLGLGAPAPRIPQSCHEALCLLQVSGLFTDYEICMFTQVCDEGLDQPEVFFNATALVTYYGQEQMVDDFACIIAGDLPESVCAAIAHDAAQLDFSAVTACWLSGFVSGIRKSLREWLVDPVLTRSSKWCDTIVDTVKGLFEKFLGPYKRIVDGLSYVDSLWGKCKTWAQNVLAEGSKVFSVMWETHCISFVVIIACACTILVENVLCTLGIVPMVGTLTGFVLSAALGILGCGSILAKSEDMALVSVSIKTFLGILLCPPNLQGDGPGLDLSRPLVAEDVPAMSWTGVDRVLSALSSVGTGLCGFRADTIIYWGRFAQAFDSFKRGKDALCSMASWIFEKLGEVYNRVTGKEAAFFHELSTLVAIDIQGWLRDSRRVIAESVTFALTDSVALTTVERLINDGETIQTTAASTHKQHSMQFGQILAERMRELKKLRKDMAHAGEFEGRRCTPFWLYVYGPSGCGKTTTMHSITQALLQAFEFPSDSFCSKNPKDAFWSMYRRQALVQIDDLGAVTESGLEQEMMAVVSSASYNPTMAIAEDKTTLFDSRFLVTTSNFYSAGTDAKIADRTAYNRRRKVVLKTRPWPGKEFDPAHSTDAVQFVVVERDDAAQTPIWCQSGVAPDDKEKYWMDYRTTMAYVVEQARIHHTNEDIEQRQYIMSHSRSRQLYQVCENYLDEVKGDVAEFIPGDLVAARNLVPQGRFFFSCVDGRAYSYDASRVAHDEGPVDPRLNFEQNCLDKLSYTIQKQIQGGPKSATAGIFLRSMVSGECVVESVSKLNSTASKEHNLFFHTLPLADRVYLRLVQKKVLQISMCGDPLGVRSYNCLMDAFSVSYTYVKENGGRLLLILVSCMLLALACYTFFNCLATILGGTSVAAGAAAMMNIEACASTSVYSSEYGERMQRRNMPHRSRNVPAVWGEETGYDNKWQLCGFLNTTRSDMPVVHVNLVPGNKFAITKHQAKAIPEGSTVGLNFPGHIYRTFRWVYSAIEEFEQSEICFYFDAIVPSLSKQMAKVYAHADLDALAVKYFETRTLHLGLQKDEMTKRHWDASATVLYTPKTIVSTINGVIYRQEIPTSITYKRNSVKHDCGALVFTEVKGQPMVVGMVVGCLDGTTYVCKFPEVRYEVHACVPEIRGFNLESGVSTMGYSKLGWIDRRHQPHNSEKSEFVPIPEDKQMQGVSCKSPAILSAKDPRLTERPNCAGYDPYKDGMAKFAAPMADIDQGLLDIVADEIAQEFLDAGVNGRMVSSDEMINGHQRLHPITPFYVENADSATLNEFRAECDTEVWSVGGPPAEFEYPYISRPLEGKSKWFCDHLCQGQDIEGTSVLDISVFVKKVERCCEEIFFDPIDLTTSEGYPLFLDRPAGEKGKERFFSGDAGQKQLIPGSALAVLLENGHKETCEGTPTIIIKESAKDELLKESKVLPSTGKPGTRLFSICPAWYNLLVRQQFVYVAEKVRRKRKVLCSQVGIVVGSREWDDLAMRLRSKKNSDLYCCDYSKFDGLMTPQVMLAIANIYNRMYTGKDGMNQYRINLLMGLTNRLSICGSQVYRVGAGIPSGFALTVDINSIFNEILVRCAYRSLVPEIERPFFSRNVALVVYGDDNVFGVHPNVSSVFNGNALKTFLREEFSIQITDGADKLSPVIEARPLEQCEFLKRAWVLDKQYGLFRAPLVETSIYSCLKYVRQQNFDWTMPLLQNVQGSLYEASLHSREMHEKIYRHFAHHFPKWVQDRELDTYEQCRVRFIAAKNGQFDFHPASAQLGHVFSQQPEVQSLASGQNPKRTYQLTGKLYVCASGHNEPECFYVDVRSKAQIFKGNGVHVPPRFGSGSGQIASVKWATSFRSSKGLPCRDEIFEAYKLGKCIYFRDSGECINAWLAAINFGWSVGADGLDGLLQRYRSLGPSHVNDLSYYFEGGVAGIKGPPLVKCFNIDPVAASRVCPKTTFEKAVDLRPQHNVNAAGQVQNALSRASEAVLVYAKDSAKCCVGLKCGEQCLGHKSTINVVAGSPYNERAMLTDVFRRGCFSLTE